MWHEEINCLQLQSCASRENDSAGTKVQLLQMQDVSGKKKPQPYMYKQYYISTKLWPIFYSSLEKNLPTIQM